MLTHLVNHQAQDIAAIIRRDATLVPILRICNKEVRGLGKFAKAVITRTGGVPRLAREGLLDFLARYLGEPDAPDSLDALIETLDGPQVLGMIKNSANFAKVKVEGKFRAALFALIHMRAAN